MPDLWKIGNRVTSADSFQPGSSQRANLSSGRRWLALGLWTLPLAVPCVGLSYLGVKLYDGETIGPYSLTLAAVCFVWFAVTIVPLCRARYRRAIQARLFHLLAAYFAAAGAFIVAELVLTVLDATIGLPLCHPINPTAWSFFPDAPPLAEDFLADSERGSRYRKPGDANFNRQGFRDRDDFTAKAAADASLRVLLSGDSFAFGVAAINDGSNTGFADLLESRLKSAHAGAAVLWNTAIPGTGQHEQSLHLKRFLPVLNPQYVLLAIYEGNDLNDNQLPVGRYFVFSEGTWADRYRRTGDGFELLSPRNAWLRAMGYGIEPASPLLTLRTTSTMYRLFRKVRDRVDRRAEAASTARGIEVTGALLRKIQHQCRRAAARLFVLLIPKSSTVASTGDVAAYDSIRSLLEELQIPALDMRPRLTADDYAPAPDLHWNKSGHKKAADALFETFSQQWPELKGG